MSTEKEWNEQFAKLAEKRLYGLPETLSPSLAGALKEEYMRGRADAYREVIDLLQPKEKPDAG